MKFLRIGILLGLFLISCADKKLDKDDLVLVEGITIPSIEKNSKDKNFNLKNGILYYQDKPFSGVVKEFYNKNSIKSESEYYLGKRHGKFFGYYSDKKKWFERFYKKGIKTDTHKGWFNNEKPMFEYQFNDKGVYHGSLKDWHQNGQLAKHFNFKDGKEIGSQRMWKLNGEIRANFYTVKGERHGLIGLKNCVSVISEENINK